MRVSVGCSAIFSDQCFVLFLRHRRQTDRSTFVARIIKEDMSKALLRNTNIFSFATINFPLQRTQHSPPQEIFFGRFHSSLLISGSKAGNLACTRELRSREGHSSFILSRNLIGQRENKSCDVTELVLRFGLEDVIFRRSEATAGNTSAFAGYRGQLFRATFILDRRSF